MIILKHIICPKDKSTNLIKPASCNSRPAENVSCNLGRLCNKSAAAWSSVGFAGDDKEPGPFVGRKSKQGLFDELFKS